MMRQVIVCLALLLSLAVTFGSENSFASSEEFKTISLAKQTIHNDNLVEAKKGAVFQAMRAAVQEAVVKMVSKSGITENLDLIYEKVLADPKKYVVTYRVIAEIEKQEHYLVALEAAIDTRALEKFFTRANILNPAKENPSILILISEQSDNGPTRYWWGEDSLPYESFADGALGTLLENKGYTIAGTGSPRPDPASLGITFDFIHDSNAAIKLGTALKADMVIMGRAMAKKPLNLLNDELSCKAVISLDVFSTETGERITSIDQEAVVSGNEGDEGSRKALAMAGELAGEAVVSKIQDQEFAPGNQEESAVPEIQEEAAVPEIQEEEAVPKFQEQESVPKFQEQESALKGTARPIETRMEGDDYLSNFIMLRKVLGSMPGIEAVQAKELRTDHAVVDILFKGNARKLADLLMLKNFDSFSLEMSDVTEESMAIRFVTKKNAEPLNESEVKKSNISEKPF